jgi:hypothetical protein
MSNFSGKYVSKSHTKPQSQLDGVDGTWKWLNVGGSTLLILHNTLAYSVTWVIEFQNILRIVSTIWH